MKREYKVSKDCRNPEGTLKELKLGYINLSDGLFDLAQMNFDMVYLAEYDRCVPSRNQKNFWQNFENINIIKLETGHFPFYNYKNFEEIIN